LFYLSTSSIISIKRITAPDTYKLNNIFSNSIKNKITYVFNINNFWFYKDSIFKMAKQKEETTNKIPTEAEMTAFVNDALEKENAKKLNAVVEETIDISAKFLKHNEVTLADIRRIGNKFFDFLKSSGIKEKFVKLDGDKVYMDFMYCSVEALFESDETLDKFNEVTKDVTGLSLHDLKGDNLKDVIDYTIAFLQKNNGFFSSMTGLFLNTIRG